MKRFKVVFKVLLVALFGVNNVIGQSSRTTENAKYQKLIERFEVRYDFLPSFHSDVRPIDTKDVLTSLYENRDKIDPKDYSDFIDLMNQYDFIGIGVEKTKEDHEVYLDSSQTFYTINSSASKEVYKARKPILKYFYNNPHHLYSINKKDFKLRLNPIVDFSLGNSTNTNQLIFQNTRGLKVEGIIDNKVYLYTSLLENQSGFNTYVNDRISLRRSIPGNGLYKTFKSTVAESVTGYDYLNAKAYVGLPISKSVAIEFGHGNHFIGNGNRSLLLSDYANNYLYLKFNTRVWKLNYQNIFGELAAVSANNRRGDVLIPKKYFANHYLSFRPAKNIEIGLFETVVFSRSDHFDFQYLNPIIFYRTVEQFIGSPDNVMLGLNYKYQLKNRVLIYGQFILDEFKLDKLKAGGWWANKYGSQIGLKYFDFGGISHLDLGVEYNFVRPFTYSHNRSISENFDPITVTSYSHYGQELAHPLGSNFKEIIVEVNYRPLNKWSINTTLFYMQKGENPEGENLGSDILIDNGTRLRDEGNFFLQGETSNTLSVRGNIDYEFFKNYKLGLNALLRSNSVDDRIMYIGGSLRVNIDPKHYDF